MSKFDDCEFPSCLGTLVLYNLWFSVVCSSRTVFGNRKSAHVHLEGWKHGNGGR